MTELAKRDIGNGIPISEHSYSYMYTKDGYLYTANWSDIISEPSIVAYKIQKDAISLLIRIISLDQAYRENYTTKDRDSWDWFTVTVHDYYLVELLYKNDKMVTNYKPVMDIRDINTVGFIFNEAKISGNIKKLSNDYYMTYPRLETKLTEGTKIKIASITYLRTKDLSENSSGLEIYDYYYNILVNGKQVRINGYLLDFENKINYREKLLSLKN